MQRINAFEMYSFIYELSFRNHKPDYITNNDPDPKRNDPTRIQPGINDPKKNDPTRIDPNTNDPQKVDPTRIVPEKNDPQKNDPTHIPDPIAPDEPPTPGVPGNG